MADPSRPLPDIAGTLNDHPWRGPRPSRWNHASGLGHPCARALTYKRSHWQFETEPSPTLRSIWEEGNLHEHAVIEAMGKRGFRVSHAQATFEYPEHEIVGSIDGFVMIGRRDDPDHRLIPFDVKSTTDYQWKRLTTVEDLVRHERYYVRSWRSQLVLYQLLTGKDQALILLKNKSTGLLKQIDVSLRDEDYEHGEDLIRKADLVNQSVKAGTLPDRIPYDESVCGDCSFEHICLPDQAARAMAAFLDVPELAEQLSRRAALEEAASEYDRLDKAIKSQAKLFADGDTVIGVDWLLRVKTIHVSAEKAPRKAHDMVRVEVHSLKKGE